MIRRAFEINGSELPKAAKIISVGTATNLNGDRFKAVKNGVRIKYADGTKRFISNAWYEGIEI